MKLVTQNYGCGISSSIYDYGIEDVVTVSPENYNHVYDVDDDLFFIGHDFLFFLWDTEEKVKKWVSRKGKWEHWAWCFERIDAIVPAWLQKSHVSLTMLNKFCDRILACDEDDCDKYGFDWLPQWASCVFYEKKTPPPNTGKFLFSGQAGKPEYRIRNELLNAILKDTTLKDHIVITNTSRSLGWDKYVQNLMSYPAVVNPFGVLKALNTRAYETLYSGRLLLQHKVGNYRRHEKMLKDVRHIIFFQNLQELKDAVKNINVVKNSSNDFYTSHSLYARMKNIGVNIK